MHRLRDLQAAATEQLLVTEALQKQREEHEQRIKELGDENHALREVRQCCWVGDLVAAVTMMTCDR